MTLFSLPKVVGRRASVVPGILSNGSRDDESSVLLYVISGILGEVRRDHKAPWGGPKEVGRRAAAHFTPGRW